MFRKSCSRCSTILRPQEGLLISVAASDAAPLIGKLCDAGIDAVKIGEVLPRQKPLIAVSA